MGFWVRRIRIRDVFVHIARPLYDILLLGPCFFVSLNSCCVEEDSIIVRTSTFDKVERLRLLNYFELTPTQYVAAHHSPWKMNPRSFIFDAPFHSLMLAPRIIIRQRAQTPESVSAAGW